MPEPTVIPKGYARTAQKLQERYANHRAYLFSYIRRFCPAADGTSGVVAMYINQWDAVKVNGQVQTDLWFEVKHGDIISIRPYDNHWVDYTVTGDLIEKTW